MPKLADPSCVTDNCTPFLQMIAERELVFQMNNKIIKSFRLPRFAYMRYIINLLPPEILLTLMFAVIAVFFVWASPRLVRWAATTKLLGEHMRPIDPDEEIEYV